MCTHQDLPSIPHRGGNVKTLRACINDVPKIKIGKNQNQNWALIGRGSKTSRLRCYLIFWKSLPNQRSQNRGCSPDRRLSECYTPEARAQQLYNSSTKRDCHTHNFCWHGPRQRSHGEGQPLLLPAGGEDRSNEWCDQRPRNWWSFILCIRNRNSSHGPDSETRDRKQDRVR